MHWLMRALFAWDVGVALYLALTYAMMWRAKVERIRRRAAEQDEGAAFILVLSIVATFASLVAIVFAFGGAKQEPHSSSLQVLLTIATIMLSWAFVHTIFRSTTRTNIMANAATERSAGLRSRKTINRIIAISSISRWSSA